MLQNKRMCVASPIEILHAEALKFLKGNDVAEILNLWMAMKTFMDKQTERHNIGLNSAESKIIDANGRNGDRTHPLHLTCHKTQSQADEVTRTHREKQMFSEIF